MRSSLAFALALSAPVVALGQPSPGPAVQVVERIVAVVDDRPVFLSEVRTLGAVRGLDGEAARVAAVEERLMHLEAARLPQAEVSREEEDRGLEQLLEARPALRHQVEEPDLRRLVRRQIAILKYVEFRFRPQLRIGEDEVRRAWDEAQAGRPSGPAFEDQRDELRARLERRALDERIEAWVAELRQRADVRYVGEPPPPGPRGP